MVTFFKFLMLIVLLLTVNSILIDIYGQSLEQSLLYLGIMFPVLTFINMEGNDDGYKKNKTR